MTHKYKLEQIYSSIKAKWEWCINLECDICGKDTAVCTCWFDLGDNRLTAGVICEKCWKKFKEMKK